MRKRYGLAMAAIGLISLFAVSSASAAVEVGSNCAATSGAPNYTMTQLAQAPGSPLPLTAPNAGVVTKWKVNSKIASEFQEQLKVLRGSGKTFQTVAESAFAGVNGGQNTFDTQIPVQAGDRFAVFGGPTSVTLYCAPTAAGDEMGVFNANATVGSINEYTPVATAHVALAVVIEPDADGDGAGDESQDKCPRSKALQTVECPIIGLSSYGIASKGSALVLISASSQASVTVSATVKVPKGGKKGKGTKTVVIPAGTKPVGDGQVVPFAIVYSQGLKAALAALPPGKSLAMAVTATTTDLAGQVSTSQVNLKLKGQKKGKAKEKAKS